MQRFARIKINVLASIRENLHNDELCGKLDSIFECIHQNLFNFFCHIAACK